MKISMFMCLSGLGILGMLNGCATSSTADPHAALIRDAIQMGFHKKTIDGVVNWCHGYVPMGSHLEREECMTEDRMAAFLKEQQFNRDNLSKPGACTSGGNCSGG
jgi:hypothetical protein